MNYWSLQVRTTVRCVPDAFVPTINIEINNNTAPTSFENRMFLKIFGANGDIHTHTHIYYYSRWPVVLLLSSDVEMRFCQQTTKHTSSVIYICTPAHR